jgi:hypothetical protein
MQEERNTFVLRLSPQVRQLVADHYVHDNCKSQNEFVEKAIRFYAGYISAKDNTEFLTHTLASAIRGTIDDSENRTARLLFKLAVEVSMMMHVLASGLDISNEELSRLRGRSVNEVKRTSGRVSFDDAVKYHQDG